MELASMAQMCIVSQIMPIFLYFKPHTMVIIHLDQALEHGSFKHYAMRYFESEVWDRINIKFYLNPYENMYEWACLFLFTRLKPVEMKKTWIRY